VQDFNLYYEQQFSNFGGDFWLPVDVRIDGLIEVGIIGLRFPPIGFHQVSKMNNYKVNVPLPDSLYKTYNLFSVDSTTINKPDSIFTNTVEPVPLSSKEELAYKTLDSTATLEKTFRPTGFLTRFLDLDDEDEDGNSGYTVSSEGGGSSNRKRSSSTYERGPIRKFVSNLSPIGRFNRVDVFNIGVQHERRYLDRRLESNLKIGYSFGYEDLSYGVGLSWWPLEKTRRFVVSAKYDADTRSSYNSDLYGMTLASVMPLFGYDDYFNYYRNERFELATGFRPTKHRYTYRLYYNLEEHSSINYNTSYDILGRDNVQRINPPIEDGTLSSIKFQISRGDLKNNFGVIELNGTSFSVEQSSKVIGSDWNFTKFNLNVFKRFNTLYKKRFFPNTLDIRINAGTYLGELPVQENGALDAAFGYITPFVAFKSKRYIPYQGSSYFAVNAEHNFRSVPLEILGWRNAPQTGLSIIAFGGVGKTWNSTSNINQFGVMGTDDLHLEVGGSVSNIFNLFRVDFAFRIDDPGFYPGVSVARFF
jgi:hypothetical protein